MRESQALTAMPSYCVGALPLFSHRSNFSCPQLWKLNRVSPLLCHSPVHYCLHPLLLCQLDGSVSFFTHFCWVLFFFFFVNYGEMYTAQRVPSEPVWRVSLRGIKCMLFVTHPFPPPNSGALHLAKLNSPFPPTPSPGQPPFSFLPL